MKGKFIIVTRHAGTVEWLARQGIAGRVVENVSDEDELIGEVVIGNLPPHLSSHTRLMGVVEFPLLGRGQQGGDLSADEMEQAGASIGWYSVRRTFAPSDLLPASLDRRRLLALPSGMEIVEFPSEYQGGHPEYGTDEDLTVAVPAGTYAAGIKFFHTSSSRGNWAECFARMPGCLVWDDDAGWMTPDAFLD